MSHSRLKKHNGTGAIFVGANREGAFIETMRGVERRSLSFWDVLMGRFDDLYPATSKRKS